MRKSAKTAEDYRLLSHYFQSQGERFHLWAEQQRTEMLRSQQQVGDSRYPSAYDRARNLQQYYATKAAQALSTAKRYEERAKVAEAATDADARNHHP